MKIGISNYTFSDYDGWGRRGEKVVLNGPLKMETLGVTFILATALSPLRTMAWALGTFPLWNLQLAKQCVASQYKHNKDLLNGTVRLLSSNNTVVRFVGKSLKILCGV